MTRERVSKTQAGLEWLAGGLMPDVSREEAHRVHLLVAIGSIIVATGTLFLAIQLTTTLAIPSLPPAPWIDIVTDVAVVFVGGLTVWLVRSGHTRLAAWVVLSSLWTAATTQLYLQGHPSTDLVGAFGLFLVVALAVVLLDQRGAWMSFTVAAAVSFIGIHVLWLGGYLPPPIERGQNLPGEALFSVISWVTCTGIALVVIGSTVGILRDQTETLRLRIAERKQIERALRRSERDKEIILNATSEWFAYHNTDLEIQWANQAAADSVGLNLDDLIGRRCYEVWGQRHQPCEGCPVLKALQTGEARSAEQTTPDGRVWLLRGYPILDEHGRVEGLVEFGQDITERKEAQRALRGSEERYRALFESSPDGITLVGLDGMILDCNLATSEIAGLPREEIVGRSFTELGVLDADLQPRYVEIFSRLVNDEETEHLELRTARDDGQMRCIEVFATPVTKQGEIYAIQVIARDITERKQAEEALRNSQNMLETILQNMPGGMLLVGQDYKIYQVNNRTCEITGYSEEELVGELCDIICPKGSASKECPIWAKGQDGFIGMDTTVKCKGGHKSPIVKNAQRITINDKVYILENFQDITERKQAEEELSFQSMLLDQIQDKVTATDLDGRITYVNEAECRVFGKTADEIIGQHVEQYGEDPDRGATQQEIIKTTLTEGSWRGEVVNITEDGREVILDCRTQLVRDGRGEPIGMLGISTDITEHKEMEQQLRRHERLAAVGQLAAGIAHDFRNLLSTIILYTQLSLRTQGLPLNVAQNLQTIVNESYKATNLVQQILDFSSRAMIEPRPLDLTALAKEVLDVLARIIPEHIHLALDVQDTEPNAYVVEADAGRIQQALTNLALNARDAMPNGGELCLELSRVTIVPKDAPPVADITPGNWICLSVSDTGTGMTEEIQDHLFEPFFTTKEVGKGTGLGLAQVYGIVRQHKGHINVETKPGEGTIFHIYLPAYEGEAEGVAIAELDIAYQGQGEMILLVEDEEKLREAGQAMLESLGYRVVTAANGREALAMCQSPHWSGKRPQRIRLVITDLVMPEMGGEELMYELQKTKPGLQVLAITGYALRKDSLQMLKEKGFVDVISKPFEVDALARVIHRTLSG